MPQEVDPQMFLGAVRPALEQGNATQLAQDVLERWSPCQIGSLLAEADVDVRRVAAVVLGLIGGGEAAHLLARALHDEDEQVNQMAEHGLWSVWFRSGRPAAAQAFATGVALLEEEAYDGAVAQFRRAIEIDADFAEAYHQLGIALFMQGRWEASAAASQQAVRRMPVHFAALAGVGHALTQLGRYDEALQCYRQALEVNPRMQPIQDAVDRLDRKLTLQPTLTVPAKPN